jgi:putative ABC transport system permease protein
MKSGLAQDLRTATTPAGSRIRLRNVLVVLQTAVAMILTIGAGLLTNSAVRLGSVEPGFDPRDVVWLDVTLPAHSYTTAGARGTFFNQAAARLRSLSGVVQVGAIAGRPLGGGNAVATVFPEGPLPPQGASLPRVPIHAVAEGYFAAMRIPIVDGRDITAGDDLGSPRVAVVSRAFANRFWPGDRAVGKAFWMGRVAADAPLTMVVGVAEDVRQYGLDQQPTPMVYRAFAQGPRANLTLVARHDGRAPASLLESMRQAVWAIDGNLPLGDYGTMTAQVRQSIAAPRFRATILTALGIIAAALACVGLYSTLAWIVRARRRELGIRITLGAGAGDVQRLVLRRGAVLTATGLALGSVAAVFATRALATMVFGITPTDAPTFALAITAMAIVAMTASWIPARRASTVNPVETLRNE